MGRIFSNRVITLIRMLSNNIGYNSKNRNRNLKFTKGENKRDKIGIS